MSAESPDKLGGSDDRYSVAGFREEMRDMPLIQRGVVYISLVLMFALFIEAIVIFPLILIKYGWGYTVNGMLGPWL